jgi:hypothetical protein|tara:strand:- start:739 stop:993 length:255 start_codon:yes stop_codon:yes gene_type:complete
MKVKIIHEKCDPEKATDTSLPYTAYLVSYKHEDKICYDVTISNKAADIFDHYYDLYKNVISMTQANGKVNPKLWVDPKQPKKKK